ncbi:MAG: sulfotransferase domain-containing protein, partial [Acidimicrobiales bacterium]
MRSSSVAIPRRAQLFGRALARTVGRITAGGRMTPSFLIVGAQRCGTTSMYKAISQHRSVLPAVLHKGVHYFDTGYGNSWSWYLGHFPLRAHARWVSTRTGGAVVSGESSPYYLFHPLAPERIARDLPLARLIVMVRDPVERAYSAHAHELARGYETEPFEKALELE